MTFGPLLLFLTIKTLQNAPANIDVLSTFDAKDHRSQFRELWGAEQTISDVNDLRFHFRKLWRKIMTRDSNKTICLPLARGDIKTVARGIVALNATRGELDSLAFYNTNFMNAAVGMRVSFAFPRKITQRTMARILAIVDVRPTGHWRLFDLCQCHAKKISEEAYYRQIQP